MLQMSEAASLALHSMAILAQHPGQSERVREIAAKTKSSQAHLAKVLQKLAKAGLVEATRGPKGGYALVKPGGSITLLQVYEAVEGPLEEPSCLLASGDCPFTKCMFGDLFPKLNRQIRDYLAGNSLADFSAPSEEW